MSSVKGDKEIIRKLRKLGGDKLLRKVGRKAVNKGMTPMSRAIRRAIPPSLKSVKKTVGKKIKKDKKTGVTVAKVGLGVGKRKPIARTAGKPGVGISKQNVHWWTLGTGERRKKSGASTGSMPKGPPVVRIAFQQSKNESDSVMRKTLREELEKEAKRA